MTGYRVSYLRVGKDMTNEPTIVENVQSPYVLEDLASDSSYEVMFLCSLVMFLLFIVVVVVVVIVLMNELTIVENVQSPYVLEDLASDSSYEVMFLCSLVIFLLFIVVVVVIVVVAVLMSIMFWQFFVDEKAPSTVSGSLLVPAFHK